MNELLQNPFVVIFAAFVLLTLGRMIFLALNTPMPEAGYVPDTRDLGRKLRNVEPQ